MAISYIDRVISPFVANFCRICGVFSLTTSPDDPGLFHLRPRLIYYAIASIGIALQMINAIYYDWPLNTILINNIPTVHILMILVPSFVQSMRGLLRSMINNLRLVDSLIVYRNSQANISKYCWVLIIFTLTEFIDNIKTIWLIQMPFQFFQLIDLANNLLLCGVIGALLERITKINMYLEKHYTLGVIEVWLLDDNAVPGNEMKAVLLLIISISINQTLIVYLI